DLMHMEALPLQCALLDVHLSGYIGDAVSGPTFNDVYSAADVLRSLPFYGTTLGFDQKTALRRAEQLLAELGGAPPRFVLFEPKLPQSTNRWTAAWRPWIRVRKPFLDYEVFDFWQSLAPELRGRRQLYGRWLRSRYPECFLRIPNQRTGMPVCTPSWQVNLARVTRFGW